MKRSKDFCLLHDLRISIDAFFRICVDREAIKKSEKTNGIFAAKTGIFQQNHCCAFEFFTIWGKIQWLFFGLIETICSGAAWAELQSKYVYVCCEQ
jgi:hypothetical protein